MQLRSAPPADDAEKEQLRDKLELLRGELRMAQEEAAHAHAAPAQAAAPAGAQDPALAEAVASITDALAQLRSSLRIASDEAAVMPSSDSVAVVADSLSQATEHIEAVRGTLRLLAQLVGTN